MNYIDNYTHKQKAFPFRRNAFCLFYYFLVM